MPLQNRVTPFGEIETTPARGLLMGNRGILHDERGHLDPARWRHRTWIACTLALKDRKRTINVPGQMAREAQSQQHRFKPLDGAPCCAE